MTALRFHCSSKPTDFHSNIHPMSEDDEYFWKTIKARSGRSQSINRKLGLGQWLLRALHRKTHSG